MAKVQFGKKPGRENKLATTECSLGFMSMEVCSVFFPQQGGIFKIPKATGLRGGRPALLFGTRWQGRIRHKTSGSRIRRVLVMGCAVLLVVEHPARAEEWVTPEQVIPALEPILLSALERSPRVINGNLEQIVAEDHAAVARAQLYPQVGGGGTYYLQSEDRGGEIGFSQRVLYDFSASYPLWHWGAVRANVALGRLQAAIAANNLEETYRLLAVEIRREYFGLIIAKCAVRNAEIDLELQQERLETLQLQVQAGQVAEGGGSCRS